MPKTKAHDLTPQLGRDITTLQNILSINLFNVDSYWLDIHNHPKPGGHGYTLKVVLHHYFQ